MINYVNRKRLRQQDPIAPRPAVQRTPKVFDPLSND
nr:MAG TPA: hypothetical protein [Caudoviricetes sp.]